MCDQIPGAGEAIQIHRRNRRHRRGRTRVQIGAGRQQQHGAEAGDTERNCHGLDPAFSGGCSVYARRARSDAAWRRGIARPDGR